MAGIPVFWDYTVSNKETAIAAGMTLMPTKKSKTPVVLEQTTDQEDAVQAEVKAVVEAPAKVSTTASASPIVIEGQQPVVSGPVMRKKELIDLVVERSGMKKKTRSQLMKQLWQFWAKPWQKRAN